FPNNLHQDTFLTAPIELTVENLLPRPKIKTPIGDGHHDLAPHDLALHMRVSIVLTSTIMMIATDRLVRRQLFKPYTVIMVQTGFVIVDKNTGGDVHRVDEHQAFLDTCLMQALLDLTGDVDKGHTSRCIEPQFLAIAFQPENRPNSLRLIFEIESLELYTATYRQWSRQWSTAYNHV